MKLNEVLRPLYPENPNRFFGFELSEPRVGKFGPYASLPEELHRVVEQIAELEFPIDCKSDLARKLGKSEEIQLGERAVDGKMLAMFLPASYYPISSVENLAEKLSDFYHHRRDARPRLRPCTSAELKERLDVLFEEQPYLVEAGARLFSELSSLTR